MTKFHINSNGDAKPCKATVNACQFGGDDLHFKDASDARSFAEEVLSHQNGRSALRGRKIDRKTIETLAKDEVGMRLEDTLRPKGANAASTPRVTPGVATSKKSAQEVNTRISYTKLTEAERAARRKAKLESLYGVPEQPNNPSPVKQDPYVTPKLLDSDVKDYKPLNEDSPLNRRFLKAITAFESNTGLLGSKTKTDKMLEKLVHNQIHFEGKLNDPKFTKTSIVSYSKDYANRVSHTKKSLEQVLKVTNRNSLNNLIDKAISQHEADANANEKLHKIFVEDSQSRLINKVNELGHGDGPLVSKIMKAELASEVYALEDEVRKLNKRDEFAELMNS